MTKRNKKYTPNGPARQALIRGLKRAELAPDDQDRLKLARAAMDGAMAATGEDWTKAPPEKRIDAIEKAMEYLTRQERDLVSALRVVRQSIKDTIEMARRTDVQLMQLPRLEGQGR